MKNKILKTLALASTMLFGASANALSIDYDILGDVSVKYSPTSGVRDLNAGAMLIDGSSFTLTPPANGALFTDYGHIEQANSESVLTFETVGSVTYAVSTTYTFSADFTDWKGDYYNVTTAGGEVTSYDANFTSGTVQWDLTTEVTKTNVADTNDVIEMTPVVDTAVLEMKIVDGEGSMNKNGNTLRGDSVIVFEITDVADDLIFVDTNGDGTSEDLAVLLDQLSTEDEGFYLSVVNSTNTVIDTNSIATVRYYQEMLSLLYNADLVKNPELAGFKDVLVLQDGVTGEYSLSPAGIANLQVQSFIANNAGLVNFATVSEPATLGMMSLALLGLAGFQRRRKNNS